MTRRVLVIGLMVVWVGYGEVPRMPLSEVPRFVMGRSLAENLPVYATPDASEYPVARVSAGTILRVDISRSGDDWLCVYPHEELSVWIYRECVKKGVVVQDKARIRARSTLFSPLVAQVSLGERVGIRGRYGDWYRIYAPRQARFWVIRSRSVGVGVRRLAGQDRSPGTTLEDSSAKGGVPPPELAGFALAPHRPQGVKFQGEALLDWSIGDESPSSFCLVRRGADGSFRRLAQIVLSEKEYAHAIGTAVRVVGTLWQVKGAEYPVLVPFSVQLLPEKVGKGTF